MTPYLLAIDNGSQSTKVTIFDSRGHALASARRRLKPYNSAVPGHAIHPGDDIWDSIQHACRDAMDQFSGNPADIVTVGLCTIRFCRALLTADGSLAEPVLSWMDERVSRPYEPSNPLRKYLYESTGIRRGMWTVSWYRSVLEDSHGEEPPAGMARQEDALNAEASELAPGSNGLLTLPDWLAPGNAVWRRGALLGFDGSQGRAHIYRSILEGIALTMANHTAAMEQALARRLSPVLVSGGGSRSDLMMQIVADVFDRPTRRTTVNDAAGLGAAICAAVGHGIHPDWGQATAAMVTIGDEFAPDARAARAYQKINKVYAGLTTFTDPLFRSMADGLQGLERA
jgi:sugar (pentulose or hexulose) kinase